MMRPLPDGSRASRHPGPMLALTLLEDIGLLAGLLIFIFSLLVILRPLTIHVTVRHLHGEDEEKDEDHLP
jgi:hypothetical protein